MLDSTHLKRILDSCQNKNVGLKKVDLIDLFLDKIITEKNLSNASIDSYKSDLKLFYKFLQENSKNFLSCNEEILKKWIIFLVRSGMETSTRLRKISVIKQFFSFLFQESLIHVNPSVNLLLPKKPKLIPKFLTEQEVTTLLDWMKNNSNSFKDLQTLILTEILYATGLRVSELVKLKISALSDDFNNLHITGKGNKDRVLPLGEFAKKLLLKYLPRLKSYYIKINMPNHINKWLFPNKKNHISRQSFYISLKQAASKAKINTNNISPHVLRHAFASHMLKNGADLKVIQQLLGHEDISTVEIYTHVNLEEKKKAMKKHPLSKLNI